MRLLIVEDDPWVALASGEVLAEAGHEIVGVVGRGKDAIACLEGAATDLVLTDLHLADQTGGVDVAREAEARCGTPALFLTSAPSLARAGREWALGCLTKPYGKAELVDAVAVCESLIKGRGPRPAGSAEGRLELYEHASMRGAPAAENGGRAGT